MGWDAKVNNGQTEDPTAWDLSSPIRHLVPPPPPRRHRRPWRRVLVVVLLVASTAAATAVVLLKDGDPREREPAQLPGVEVVESGWHASELAASFAFVVKNVSTDTTPAVVAHVTGYDRHGHPIEGITDLELVVGRIRPGKRIGLADIVYGKRMSEIDRLGFELDAGGPDVGDGEVTVARFGPRWELGSWIVEFTVDASFEAEFMATVYVLVRNADRELVGGSNQSVVIEPPRFAGLVHMTGVAEPEGATLEVYAVPAGD